MTVFGVGLNDADYVVQRYETVGYIDGKRVRKLIWVCPYYDKWISMLERCYSAKFHIKHPTYINCYVCDEWLTFSNFKAWMEKQDWEGNHLDKDLLVQGNKVYSPEFCMFVSREVNNFVLESGAIRGEYKIGVYKRKKSGRFAAQCNNPFTRKREHIGCFKSEASAHEAWLKRKTELAYELAGQQKDHRIASALIERYKNYKEGTE